MRVRILLLLFVAIGIGLATVHLTRQWLADERAKLEREAPRPTPAPASRFVLVADHDLRTGQFITEDDLRWQAWPDETMAPSYIVGDNRREGREESTAALIGAVVRMAISTGQPVTENSLVRPGDRGFLAAVLTPGKRAISVPVNETTSVAGLIFPGDRVDMLLTHTVRIGGEDDGGSFRVTETVLTDVRVLAIDQRLTDPADGPRVPDTATIEVDPHQAEMVQVMMQMGSLSLSLRSLSSSDEAPEGEPAVKPRPIARTGDPVRELLTFVQQQLPPGSTLTTPDRTFTLDTEVSLLRGLIAAFNAMPKEELEPVEEERRPQVVVVRGSAST
ncbi:MAG: Flp pilus assembly protein CpaB [Rhodospirillaceae bacterium]|nr:Flp pilus assembly protein CpaB [Rhodospirillaceae bacterium]